MVRPTNKFRQLKIADAAEAASATRLSSTGNTLASLIAAGAQFDLLYLNPRRQLAMLDEFYVDGPSTLDRCLPIHLVMAPTSAVVILTRIRDLGVVATELLPRCGFARPSRILPLRESRDGDLAAVEVLVTAHRGGAELSLPEDGAWHFPPPRTAPISIAEALYPGLARRLHAFADSYRPGWTSLLGDSTWTEVPTFR
jgi:hypothetical protein